MTPEPHERLAVQIDDRRANLGLSLREVAETAGITLETLRAVRRGSNAPSALTKRGIEKALGWQSGSVDLIFAGGEPVPDDPAPRVRPVAPRASVPDPLAGLPEDPAERVAELSRRIHATSRESQALAAELARLMGGGESNSG